MPWVGCILYPAWGGHKLAACLQTLGQAGVPSPSTITAILRRHNRLDPQESARYKAWQRFEHPFPNDLWQMDFKGHVAMRYGRCLITRKPKARMNGFIAPSTPKYWRMKPLPINPLRNTVSMSGAIVTTGNVLRTKP